MYSPPTVSVSLKSWHHYRGGQAQTPKEGIVISYNSGIPWQAIVKQYLNGVTVNDEVMKSINPLLVVNGRVNINKAGLPLHSHKGAEHEKTVIDANHMVATHRVDTTIW